MALDEDIELIGLPEKGSYKLVQLLLDGHPIIVCGSQNNFHVNILRDFLDSRKIPYSIFEKPLKTVVAKLVSLEGDRYRVVGMGNGDIDQQTKFFQVPYGISYDYQIGPNQDFKERLKKQFAGWQF